MAQHHEHWSEPINRLNRRLRNPPPIDEGFPKQQGLRVGALNAGSITGKVEKGEEKGKKERIQRSKLVTDFIKDYNFDIFAIIETWLPGSDTEIQLNLEDYSYVRKDRRYAIKKEWGKQRKHTMNTKMETQPNSKSGGGILIYIHNTVRYNVKSRGEYAESNVEFLHIEITRPVQLHLVALYCPQKILVDHLISLMSYFVDPLGERKIMFIGDTNIDWYGVQPQDHLGNKFFDVLRKPPYRVNQLIDQITHGDACIDHIFTNMQVLERGVMENCIKPGKGHKGIYCTLLFEEDRPAWQAQPAPGQYGKRKEKNPLRAFSQRLTPLFDDDACILAIFYKFPENVNAPEVDDVAEETHVLPRDDELAYCKRFADALNIDERMNEVDEFVGRVGQAEATATHKQCIIFTRSSRSPVFHALQKRMWYKNWDVVWQPRHVEFLGYVLEPSLTYAYTGKHTIWNRPQLSKEEAIALQESTYRYWSYGCKSIEKL